MLTTINIGHSVTALREGLARRYLSKGLSFICYKRKAGFEVGTVMSFYTSPLRTLPKVRSPCTPCHERWKPAVVDINKK